MHPCACVYAHTHTDLLVHVQGFIPSLIQQWAELFPSFPVTAALLQESSAVCRVSGSTSSTAIILWFAATATTPGHALPKGSGLVHLWDKSSTEAFQRIPDPNPLWFPAPTTALSSLGLSPEIKCLLYKEYVWMFLVTLTFALSQHCNSGLL